MARRFFQPVHVAVIPGADGLRAVAVNDTAAPVTLEVEFRAATLDGTTRLLHETAATVGTDAALPLHAIDPAAPRPRRGARLPLVRLERHGRRRRRAAGPAQGPRPP